MLQELLNMSSVYKILLNAHVMDLKYVIRIFKSQIKWYIIEVFILYLVCVWFKDVGDKLFSSLCVALSEAVVYVLQQTHS